MILRVRRLGLGFFLVSLLGLLGFLPFWLNNNIVIAFIVFSGIIIFSVLGLWVVFKYWSQDALTQFLVVAVLSWIARHMLLSWTELIAAPALYHSMADNNIILLLYLAMFIMPFHLIYVGLFTKSSMTVFDE